MTTHLSVALANNQFEVRLFSEGDFDLGQISRVEIFFDHDGKALTSKPTSKIPSKLDGLVRSMEKFFLSGTPVEFRDWDLLDLSRLSDFQKRVYDAIAQIPHGETRPYLWVAERLGQPMACRAVGQALKKNPFPVLIPCHRVTSTQGIGGFMGKVDLNSPEIYLKTRLLQLEHLFINPQFSFLLGA